MKITEKQLKKIINEEISNYYQSLNQINESEERFDNYIKATPDFLNKIIQEEYEIVVEEKRIIEEQKKLNARKKKLLQKK